MKHFIGQKIIKDKDFIRAPSLTLTQDELASIPEPPSFDDLKVNSNSFDEDVLEHSVSFADNLNISKAGQRNISRSKMTKTLKFQRRLSSIAFETEKLTKQKNQQHLRPLKERQFTTTMSNFIEEPLMQKSQQQDIHLYHVQIPQQIISMSKENDGQEEDLLYGDSIEEEKEILENMNKQKITESPKSYNEKLYEEIVDMYLPDYVTKMDNCHGNEQNLSVPFPPIKSSLEVKNDLLLTPPTKNYHKYTNSITTASDLSTLPEKLFSSPEVENRSCASSVYSECDISYNDNEVIHNDLALMINEIPELSLCNDNKNVDYDGDDEDEYIINAPSRDDWKIHKMKEVSIAKPTKLAWSSDFESSEDEDFDDDDYDEIEIRSAAQVSFVNLKQGKPKTTYFEHLKYDEDINSIYSCYKSSYSSSQSSDEYYEAKESSTKFVQV